MRIVVIFGTRPEAIKLAPVILRLKRESTFECKVCVTGQHRQMLDQVLNLFNITPDMDLKLMQPNQSLAGLTARAIEAVDRYLVEAKPQLVVVQGDTTTAFCAALAAFYRRIAVAHVEAGLRTWNLQAPWPEEANRVVISRLTNIHFAPTQTAQNNLILEGVKEEAITVTGNTVIDALFLTIDSIREEELRKKIVSDLTRRCPSLAKLFECEQRTATENRLILVTGHRRENFGKGFENICMALKTIANTHTDLEIVYPVHLNPNVQEPVRRILNGCRNIHLIDPLDYLPFVFLMERSYMIITDSGGIQEEAPSLGKPVLVMRDTTERPEAVNAGTVKLVGTDLEKIIAETDRLLIDWDMYAKMSRAQNPYGDGKASKRIIQKLLEQQQAAWF
jgi:UDP-N-acetylglucosamine 2-epimerase (non-hydrolysing)